MAILSFKSRLDIGTQQHPPELFLLIENVTFEHENSGVLGERTTPYVVSERRGTRKWQFRCLNRVWSLEISSTL